MKHICAWCGGEIFHGSDTEANGVSHGICDSCREYFFSSQGPPSFDRFLDTLPVPVLVLDEELNVVAANEISCRLLGNNREDLTGVVLGNAVECSYARLPEGCGRLTHCRSCAIRLTVTDTYKTGKSHYDVPAYNDLAFHKKQRSICFLISTEKCGEFVYLKIREIMGSECGQEKAA